MFTTTVISHRNAARKTFLSTSSPTPGLVQRFVTDWAGPRAVLTSIKLRLGVPWYAYDTLTLSGTVTSYDEDLVSLAVVGKNSLGDHITAQVTLAFPASGSNGDIENGDIE
ncbi:hypothetical protein G9444_0849 [Rhodococcus erythropolis]|uniref:Uncharacterized protein n=1 Tax=Rhodococcus erythropolis TaxID=1833 RepID=A0A6G9CM28_RHOER|nr:hypothetical protein G9444_0849 [Rhodococcus erythropolis]